MLLQLPKSQQMSTTLNTPPGNMHMSLKTPTTSRKVDPGSQAPIPIASLAPNEKGPPSKQRNLPESFLTLSEPFPTAEALHSANAPDGSDRKTLGSRVSSSNPATRQATPYGRAPPVLV